ncbi:hypothetical protein QM369_00240 [Streptococcus lutetiensis]|uniref:Uncharacterized protein n=1 Tax=Streptococcus hillyeri TaxID=2282420 RepID=A0A3L9DMK4_9STRE|nr:MULTISPECIES: hypothetical protein [Streptococcus]MCO4527329.1 hypothetical protein [Streptococcus infantarius subsp. infantarius]RLY02195.1 hypothetical protein EAF07_08055 [Streptococcus hillyeri]
MKEFIDNLCQLTVKKQITWETIHHLNVHGEPYSQQFQHILPDKSFFTNYDGRTLIVLYGEVRDFIRSETVRRYFFQELVGDEIQRLKAPESEVIKLHTIITIT